MGSRPKPERGDAQGGPAESTSCPACGAALSAGTTPLQSIVICATCCATLMWDGSFSVATNAQLDSLSPRDRARLYALAAAQRARIALRYN
jgi:hypothetical protein